jgi:hypothetical protein
VLLSSCPLPHSSHLVAALPNALRGRQSKDQGSVAQDVGGALTATGESPSAVRSQTVCERCATTRQGQLATVTVGICH